MSFTVLNPTEVVTLLKGPARDRVLIVDVRGEDFAGKGGHIRGAVNFPVDHFEDKSEVDEFIRERLSTGNLDTVVVHCYLCEQRGPSCAKRLASRLQCMERVEPRVCIVEGGFKRFQELYGGDPELVAGDDEEDGYSSASGASSTSAAACFPESCCYPGSKSSAYTYIHA